MLRLKGLFHQLGKAHRAGVYRKPLTRHDEHRAGAVLEAFDGVGMVRLIEHTPDELRLERLDPATPLSTLAATSDADATAVLAQVIAALSPRAIPPGTPTVADWASSFDRSLERQAHGIPPDLIRRGREVYLRLCHSQCDARLLHGDLHHDNVLFDTTRGWIAIDPKGVVGELEYELGAAFRNPIQLPHVFTDPDVIDARIRILSDALSLNRERVVAWAFAQAVLATIWLVEDGEPVAADHPWLTLARQLEDRCSSW